jgi:hypothetical protein
MIWQESKDAVEIGTLKGSSLLTDEVNSQLNSYILRQVRCFGSFRALAGSLWSVVCCSMYRHVAGCGSLDRARPSHGH